MNQYIYHVITDEQVRALSSVDVYRHDSLEDEGFIHLSKKNQLKWVLDRFYPHKEGLKLLVVDPSKVISKLVFEVIGAKSDLSIEDLQFPHVYGPLNKDAIVTIASIESVLSANEEVEKLISHFGFGILPVEGTLFKSTLRTEEEHLQGIPCGTAMIGMYCNVPLSYSAFHRLDRDELWHFYGGDPIELFLLLPDGSSQSVVMGNNPLEGHHIQYLIPAGVWQAGQLVAGGRYALFGCTMSPGFTSECFEGGEESFLIQAYPHMEVIIRKLCVVGDTTQMPKNFAK